MEQKYRKPRSDLMIMSIFACGAEFRHYLTFDVPTVFRARSGCGPCVAICLEFLYKRYILKYILPRCEMGIVFMCTPGGMVEDRQANFTRCCDAPTLFRRTPILVDEILHLGIYR